MRAKAASRGAGIACLAAFMAACGGGGGDGGGSADPPPQAGADCSSLSGRTFGEARITTASFANANTPQGSVSFCDVRATVGREP